ncbi:hypothetical protein [Flavobacterium sp. CLA17]|uniref:hypothetical protein n=1 Tax=Flavobacterium sp. CLA17 TaxID=2724135 RepID=UPI0014915F1C|nr:hypothetical protein [Flavobacterium sp. CLA17]QSB28510.1 hypothetical protein HAV12_007180 [Flavobacterium sp. CLA17]
MHNNLFLNRLVVFTKNGKVAYDEYYHRGINIIRGDNSSGKSTISHFIFYILGGAFNDWVKEARECSKVYAEVELNGAVITLKRNITFNIDGKGNTKQSINFYWGEYKEALDDPENWKKFNYDMTEAKKSFSNVFFESLDLPIVKGENNITFHQILRLLYVDQDSPTNSLYLYEQFDTTLTRETISNLLLGVYNQDLYDKQQRFENAKKEVDEVKSEIKIIKRFISNPSDLVPVNINTRISNKDIELSNIDNLIFEIKEKNKRVNYTQKSKLEFETLNIESLEQRKRVQQNAVTIRNFELEVEDTKYFLQALEHKLLAIKKSIVTREFLGNTFTIENCPECLSPLDVVANPSQCKLCKKEIDDSIGITQARKIEQEISFQIKESQKLNSNKEKQLIELKAKYEVEKAKLHQIQIKVNQALNDVKSFRDEKIDTLFTDRGYIEGELMQLRTLLENAEMFQSLKSKQDGLETEIETLNYDIDILKNNQIKLKKTINDAIEKVGVYLLNNDLRRQNEFFQAKEFHIDYRNNIAFISDKEAKYSASSSFYLKISARFAIFLASLKIPMMRYPRFILCDNMEDKGIEMGRAQNFQKLLVKYLEDIDKNTYQMIYTTSFIPEELNNDNYCVGEFYTENNPSLKNV